MDTKDERFRYKVEGIIAELSNYFELRFQQITRIKPSLVSMYADVLWQQMHKVRDVMGHEKMFGPQRLRVGDILASRDEAKRRAIMGPIDQASILNELVPEQDETAERRPGYVVVRSTRALYTSVDPSLGPIIELTNIWLWWDILDAADMFNFKEQKKLIEKLRSEEISGQMQETYRDWMGRRDERPITRQEILSYEFGFLESIFRNFLQRRYDEDSYMKIIKRDPVGGDDSLDDLIITLSRHISARRRLAGKEGLDEQLREYYAKTFKCDPAEVTAERAISYEDVTILRLREDLRIGLERGAVLGEPYDYKMAQAKQMARDVENYRKSLPLVQSIVRAIVEKTTAERGGAKSQPSGGRSPAAAGS